MCGIILQFLFAMFCIRMEIGRSIFKCVGDKVATFFNFAKQGASFVYGNELVNMFNVFAFAVLPVIFFFSFIVSLLYYYGTMQWTIQKLGWILQSMVGTTLCESVTVAANIFLGMTESPLVIKPYIKVRSSVFSFSFKCPFVLTIHYKVRFLPSVLDRIRNPRDND